MQIGLTKQNYCNQAALDRIKGQVQNYLKHFDDRVRSNLPNHFRRRSGTHCDHIQPQREFANLSLKHIQRNSGVCFKYQAEILTTVRVLPACRQLCVHRENVHSTSVMINENKSSRMMAMPLSGHSPVFVCVTIFIINALTSFVCKSDHLHT